MHTPFEENKIPYKLIGFVALVEIFSYILLQTHFVDIVSSLFSSKSCFGLSILPSTCTNSESNNNTAFSLGEYLSALALFLGFSQMLTPIHIFRINTCRTNIKVTLRIFLAGGVGVLISNSAHLWRGKVPPPYGNGLFWAYVSVILISTGSLLFIKNLLQPAKFQRSNSERWFQSTRNLIMEEDEHALAKLASDLTRNWTTLIKSAEDYWMYLQTKSHRDRTDDLKVSWRMQLKEKLYLMRLQKMGTSAHHILKLLEDSRFLRVLATRQPISMIYLFRAANEIGGELNSSTNLIQGVVQQLIIEPESALKHEMTYTGLGDHKPLLKELTSKPWLTHSSRYLRSIFFRLEIRHSFQMERLAAVISENTKNLLAHKYYGDYNRIWSQIQHAFHDSCQSFFFERNKQIKTNNIDYSYFEFGRLLRDITEQIGKYSPHSGEAIPFPKNIEELKSATWQETPYSCLARMYYSYFYYVSRSKYESSFSYYEDVRNNAWSHLYDFQATDENQTLKSVQRHFEILLFEQLNKNFSYDEYGYPLLVSVVLTTNLEWSNENIDPQYLNNGHYRISKSIVDLIKARFHETWVRNPERGKSLLPVGASYDPETRELKLTTGINDDKFFIVKLQD